MNYEEQETKIDSNGPRNFAIGFGVWTVVGFSFGIRSYLYAQMTGPPADFFQMVPNYMVDFYFWGMASPLIFALCLRFPIERGHLADRLVFHIFTGLVFVAVVTALTLPTLWFLGLTNRQLHPTLESYFVALITNPFMIHQGLLAYWGTVVVAHAFQYHEQAKIGRAKTSELSAQLAQAQLAALKMQIHPHFLFNTLNSIAALLHKDTEAADRMIARLSDFLRMTLKSSGTSTVTLEQELEFLKTYLEIEKIRFQEKLIVEMEIDEDAANARVPNLILQPLVENAVRHGVAKQTGIGHLNIHANRVGDRLLINIVDNGPGPQGISKRDGVGLANTRARLEQFYDEFELAIEGRSGTGGTVVSMKVPYLN